MHCVSTYPLDASDVNLPKLLRIKARSGQIGFSSHFTGIEDAVAACALGTSVIEKHFTLSRDLPGRDNKFALSTVLLEFNPVSRWKKCFNRGTIFRFRTKFFTSG